MKTIYITEAQKKKIKKAIAAQDQVGGKVNAGVMDAVAYGGGMCENVEDDEYKLGAEKGMSPYYHVTEGIEPNRMVDVQQLIRSDKFKAWFGDWENNPQNASKAVDKNGVPIIVHHGSPKFIGDSFDKEKTGNSINHGEGDIFCTTQDMSWAKRFSYPATQGTFSFTIKPDYSKPGDILSGFLNLRHPLDFFHLTDEDWKNIKNMIKDTYFEDLADREGYMENQKEVIEKYVNHQLVKGNIAGAIKSQFGTFGKQLKRYGYDGLIADMGGKDGAVEYCFLEPNQFKSIYALSFNPHSESIYESIDELDLYHGTHADFDKFDEKFYLTGVGEMAYGWGVYLSNSINTAKEYSPGGQIMTVQVPEGKYLDSRRISKAEASKLAHAFYKFYLSGEGGELYKGSEKEFWDYECSCIENVPDGSYLYGTISTFLGSDKKASEWLHSMGYVGLKFPGHNQATGERFMNYVIFDTNDVKITKKEKNELHESIENDVITLYHGVREKDLEYNIEKGGFYPRVCSEGGPKAIWLSEKQYGYPFIFKFEIPKNAVEQVSNVDYIYTQPISFNDFSCELVRTQIYAYPVRDTAVEVNICDERMSKIHFRYFPNLGMTLWKMFKNYPHVLDTYINPYIEKYQTLSESKKKVVKNDEGEIVPETCDKCGGKVVVQIHGEPVYVCKDCGKYFGTVPFTLKENIESEIVNPDDVDLSSFNIKKSLNPKFWKNGILDSRIRMKLLDIADDFIEFLGVDWAKPEDITMTGSLANFNWDENYSDIDLHIIMDYSDVDERTDFVSNYFYSQKKLWNEEHSDITIMGFPVEVFVQDINERHDSSGVYSLEKNKWLVEPEREKLASSKVNKAFIKDKVSDYMNKIDKLEYLFNKTKDDEYRLRRVMEKSDKLFDKIKGERKLGFERSGGKEINNYNIVFKALRRNGYIEKLVNIKSAAYDKLKSLQ